MLLKCPICSLQLIKQKDNYKCENGHLYDISKYGYLNLTSPAKSKGGDDLLMVKARRDFLEKNYYLNLKRKLVTLIDTLTPNNLVDCACGEGYYTKDFNCADKVAIDLSKEAIKLASKVDKHTQYLVGSIFNLPFFDESSDCIVVMFAPIPIKEIERVLKSGGYLITVTAASTHLWELKKHIYNAPYLNEVSEIDTYLNKIKTLEIKENITLSTNVDIQNLFKMTPYYYKTSYNDEKKLDQISSLTTQIHFNINIYTKH